MRTTIKDVAAKTGLSITTVSLVLNNKGDKIPQKTKDLIFETAKNMNYRPNQLALGLLAKQTKTLGLIIPDINNVFFSEFAKGIENFSRSEQYSVILCNSDDKYEQEMKSIKILADRGVDGIIMILSAESFGPKNEECLKILRTTGIPTILADCFNEVSDFTTIEINNYKGSMLAVEHLLSQGHRRIATIVGPQGLKSNKMRLRGYIESLKRSGIAFNEKLIYEGDFRYQSGYEGAKVLLQQEPTAIYCHNDMMAYGAMRALREQGLHIPEDISIVGFDDIFFSEHMDIPLTTVEQPVYQMGQKAAGILMDEIRKPDLEKKHVVFEPRLIVRKSTGSVSEK